MSAKNSKSPQAVSGWEALELILKCIFIGSWQLLQILAKKLWKGRKRKSRKHTPIERAVDSSVGTHCYIKIMGVKYHYVETGPSDGKIVIILGDAPNAGIFWDQRWSKIINQLADNDHRVITLDLRGTGGSESGSRSELSPPKAVEELAFLMGALRVSDTNPAIVIGVGIGGMLTWHLVHSCFECMVSKFVVVDAPHPNLYWQYPPAPFCQNTLYFIQWPYLPERLLAESERSGEEAGDRWASSRACDWTGPLNYVRGGAWWRTRGSVRASALLVGGRGAAAQLVRSARVCAAAAPRELARPDHLTHTILEFLIVKEVVKKEVETRGLVERVLGAVAGRLALPAQA